MSVAPLPEPVRLFDSPDNPTCRRYTDQDREAAYQLWRTTAGRSLRRVAESTGVALSTVAAWSQREGWVERAKRDDDDDRRSVRSSIASLVMGEALKSVEVVRKLRDDETGKTPAKVRFDSATWLAGLAGIVPVTKVESLTRPADDEQPATLTPQAAAALSQEERSRRKREYEEAYAAEARALAAASEPATA